jgi:hypothetical protein
MSSGLENPSQLPNSGKTPNLVKKQFLDSDILTITKGLLTFAKYANLPKDTLPSIKCSLAEDCRYIIPVFSSLNYFFVEKNLPNAPDKFELTSNIIFSLIQAVQLKHIFLIGESKQQIGLNKYLIQLTSGLLHACDSAKYENLTPIQLEYMVNLAKNNRLDLFSECIKNPEIMPGNDINTQSKTNSNTSNINSVNQNSNPEKNSSSELGNTGRSSEMKQQNNQTTEAQSNQSRFIADLRKIIAQFTRFGVDTGGFEIHIDSNSNLMQEILSDYQQYQTVKFEHIYFSRKFNLVISIISKLIQAYNSNQFRVHDSQSDYTNIILANLLNSLFYKVIYVDTFDSNQPIKHIKPLFNNETEFFPYIQYIKNSNMTGLIEYLHGQIRYKNSIQEYFAIENKFVTSIVLAPTQVQTPPERNNWRDRISQKINETLPRLKPLLPVAILSASILATYQINKFIFNSRQTEQTPTKQERVVRKKHGIKQQDLPKPPQVKIELKSKNKNLPNAESLVFNFLTEGLANGSKNLELPPEPGKKYYVNFRDQPELHAAMIELAHRMNLNLSNCRKQSEFFDQLYSQGIAKKTDGKYILQARKFFNRLVKI